MDAITSSARRHLQSAPRKVGGRSWAWLLVFVLVAGLRIGYVLFAPNPAPASASSSISGGAPVATGAAKGDVVIYGEVRRPGTYSLGPAERVASIVLRAGGMSAAANDTAVKVIRKVPGKGKATIMVNVRDVLTGALSGKDIPLQPGDIIIVEERLINLINF